MQRRKNILKLNLNSDKASFMYSLLYFIQFVVPDDDDLQLSRNMLH
jgi:hypothetical protein